MISILTIANIVFNLEMSRAVCDTTSANLMVFSVDLETEKEIDITVVCAERGCPSSKSGL